MPPPTSRRGEHGHSPATQLLRAHLRARFHLITVNARATIESYTTYASTGNVMPFGVMKGTYTPGTSYTIYGDGSSSNNGALSLDLKSGSSCGGANGANDLRNTINGSSIACPVSVGESVDTKPGSNTGPVAQG